MLNFELENLINTKLNSKSIKDNVPNGLQVEGRKNVENIVTGVTVCQELLNEAVKENADAVIVHHGFFWKNEESVINGIKRQRLKTILTNEINLYAWHLPLDMSMEIGNNIQIALKLNAKIVGNITPFVMMGELNTVTNRKDMLNLLKKEFNYNTICCNNGPNLIKRLAWCSGAGQKFIGLASKLGMDAYITGEISEESVYLSKEYMINFYSIGHYSSEVGGIISLGEWLNKEHKLKVKFIDVYNKF